MLHQLSSPREVDRLYITDLWDCCCTLEKDAQGLVWAPLALSMHVASYSPLRMSSFTRLLGGAGEGSHVPPAQDHCQRTGAALERPHERLRLNTAAAAPQFCAGQIVSSRLDVAFKGITAHFTGHLPCIKVLRQ